MVSRRHNRPTPPAPSCRNHPGVPALPGKHLCQSCEHYAKLAPEVMGPPKAEPAK